MKKQYFKVGTKVVNIHSLQNKEDPIIWEILKVNKNTFDAQGMIIRKKVQIRRIAEFPRNVKIFVNINEVKELVPEHFL